MNLPKISVAEANTDAEHGWFVLNSFKCHTKYLASSKR